MSIELCQMANTVSWKPSAVYNKTSRIHTGRIFKLVSWLVSQPELTADGRAWANWRRQKEHPPQRKSYFKSHWDCLPRFTSLSALGRGGEDRGRNEGSVRRTRVRRGLLQAFLAQLAYPTASDCLWSQNRLSPKGVKCKEQQKTRCQSNKSYWKLHNEAMALRCLPTQGRRSHLRHNNQSYLYHGHIHVWSDLGIFLL